MVSSATNKNSDIVQGRILPGFEFINNLKNLASSYRLSSALLNSLKYALVLTIVSLFICSLAGYGFEVYHDKIKDTIMNIFPFYSLNMYQGVTSPTAR